MPLNNHIKRRGAHCKRKKTNRQTRKGSKCIWLCVLQSTHSSYLFDIHSLSSSMLIISCCWCLSSFFLNSLSSLFHCIGEQRERGCAAFTNNTKDFLKSMNGIDCSIFKRNGSVAIVRTYFGWLCISFQIHFCMYSFIYCGRSIKSLSFGLFLVRSLDNRFPMKKKDSQEKTTCAYRSAFFFRGNLC